jgi:hypothetical protein
MIYNNAFIDKIHILNNIVLPRTGFEQTEVLYGDENTTKAILQFCL